MKIYPCEFLDLVDAGECQTTVLLSDFFEPGVEQVLRDEFEPGHRTDKTDYMDAIRFSLAGHVPTLAVEENRLDIWQYTNIVSGSRQADKY